MEQIEASAPRRDSLVADLLNEAEAAQAVARSPRWLRGERAAGRGPKFIRLGSSIFYEREELRAWLKSLTVDPTARSRR